MTFYRFYRFFLHRFVVEVSIAVIVVVVLHFLGVLPKIEAAIKGLPR